MNTAISYEQATALATAIETLPDVASLHRGRFGEVALLFPEARVAGIRLNPDSVEVHVALYDTTASIPAVSQAIQQLVQQHLQHLAQASKVEVTIDDLVAADTPSSPATLKE